MEFTRFKSYINGKFDYGDFQIIPIIVNIVSYIYLYSEYQKNKEKTIDKQILLNFQFIGILLLLLTGVNTLFLRISYMFTIFQIISVPLFYCENKKYKNILGNIDVSNWKFTYNKVFKLIKSKIKETKIYIKKINNQISESIKNFDINNMKKINFRNINLNITLKYVIIMYIIAFSYINIFHNVEECLPYKTIIGSDYNEKA